MEEEKIYEEKMELICSVCETQLIESEAVKKNDTLFCTDCWNKKIMKERGVLSAYAFFVVFILFQLCFYIPALVHEFIGFPTLRFIVICVVIGTICGIIAYEVVYARITRKLGNAKTLNPNDTLKG